MTCLGNALGIAASAGLIWLGALCAIAAALHTDAVYGVLAVVFFASTVIILAQLAREKGEAS